MKVNFLDTDSLDRVATVRERYLENEIFFGSGKSQGILLMAREIRKDLERYGKRLGI